MVDFDLASIVLKAQRGDSAAFDTLYDRYTEPLFRFLVVRCGNPSLAEELLGDVWVRIVEGLPAFRFPQGDTEAAFAGWLYRIARNLVIDNYRRKSNTNVPLDITVAARDALPDEHVIASDERREVHEALQLLTPEQREVVLLRFIEERSTAEVATLTGRTEGAVKVMQHRALGALARVFGVERGRRATQ